MAEMDGMTFRVEEGTLYNTIRHRRTGELRSVGPGGVGPRAHGMEPAEEWEFIVQPTTSFSGTNPSPPMKESILSEAKRLVEGGERNQSYGPPEMDFKRIAGMWTALFEAKLKEGVVFDPADVARAQICLKLSRSTWQKKRDNWTDQAGYAACGHRCETGEW